MRASASQAAGPRSPEPGRILLLNWWPVAGLPQLQCHSISMALPFPHTLIFPETPSVSGTVPPPRPHDSQNSGEVSEPPQPQLLAPLRTCWDRPVGKSATATVSKPSGRRLPMTCFCSLVRVLRGVCTSQTSDCLLSDFFWCVFEVAFCYSALAHSTFLSSRGKHSALRRALTRRPDSM